MTCSILLVVASGIVSWLCRNEKGPLIIGLSMFCWGLLAVVTLAVLGG